MRATLGRELSLGTTASATELAPFVGSLYIYINGDCFRCQLNDTNLAHAQLRSQEHCPVHNHVSASPDRQGWRPLPPHTRQTQQTTLSAAIGVCTRQFESDNLNRTTVIVASFVGAAAATNATRRPPFGALLYSDATMIVPTLTYFSWLSTQWPTMSAHRDDEKFATSARLVLCRCPHRHKGRDHRHLAHCSTAMPTRSWQPRVAFPGRSHDGAWSRHVESLAKSQPQVIISYAPRALVR